MISDPRRTASPTTPQELDAEAKVTPQVEREADIAAQQYGSDLFRAMLAATPDRAPDGRA